MKDVRFEWDDKKDSANKHKHGISFEEAQTVFFDPNARLIADPDHSEHEERFIILGMSYTLKIIVVCHCYKSKNEVIRIISARKAMKKEEKTYMELL
jgi:uncharacterized DUF497 family protein